MAPLEPQEKVLVAKEFLSSPHGKIACESCHGGNAASMDKAAGHTGMDPHPSSNNPQKACGDCHGKIVATAKDSLHATLSTFPSVLKSRANMDKWAHIDEARKNHCAACHTSCGGCHVSRPKFAQKGFVKGHLFQKRTDPINQCTACHGSRVGFEFYGERGQGDVHAAKAAMDCVACHSAREMHAAAPKDLPGRYHLKEMARCTDCHKDLERGPVPEHQRHIGRVQCQVCHSQTYVNCYNCHVGKDSEGLAFFQNRREVETVKIGLNYDDKAPGAGYRYMLVRHVPSYPEMFDFYGKGGFTNFGKTPTWKRASPHNIQRRTWQAASCNHCHGNRALFLASSDLLDYEKEANRKVVVPDGSVPQAIKKVRKVAVDTSKVRTGMVVDARWLHDNLGKKNVVVVDTRGSAAFDKGHIEGAISFDPLTSGLRTGGDAEKAFVLVPHARVAEILGSKGIAAGDHIVVYDQSGVMATALGAVLQWAGATNVSYLNGGIEGWHEAGFHTSTKPSTRQARIFNGTVQPSLVVDSDTLAKLLGKPNVVVLDARAIHRVLGETRHELARRVGAIPGSINLPLGALIMDNGALKPPEELLWMLKTYGITPDKTVITTCDTGIAASDAFFILRYLGFPDVRVHDEAWVNWSIDR
ncbi:Putative thiosulfate sulfurtransferase [Geobacteraceae bacterium]|nr:Putative thiosulfate sulfurtransferase [Geobacteraceae bacterium]